MGSPALSGAICVVEDDTQVNSALCAMLNRHGYLAVGFASATEFLDWWELNREASCELLISDISMPGPSGFDLCRQVRVKVPSQLLPIILMTGSDTKEKIQGLDAGADEFINKPFRSDELIAKVRSLLRIRTDQVQIHTELRSTKDNNSNLTRFVSPSVAELLKSEATRGKLKPHRSDVTVMFFDLRRFTSLASRVEPEVVMQVLSGYYTAVGQAALRYQGTLGHLAGDGIMVFFNDPQPVENPQKIALEMAIEVRSLLQEQKLIWDACQYDLDFGIGIDRGFATIGGIGFDSFWQYSVIGTVSNFASRLCHAADHGQILVSKRFLSELQGIQVKSTAIGNLVLKGIPGEVSVFNVDSILLAISDTQKRAA